MPTRNLLIIFVAVVVSIACYSVAIKKQTRSAKYSEILDLVMQQALQKPAEEDLFDASIDGMMKSLDEHSRYFSNRDFEEFQSELKQQFGGVGMYIITSPINERITVSSPIPNSPAFDAGVMAGDIVDAIAGKSTLEMTSEQAVEQMRGPVDTAVEVTFLRGEKRFTRALTRKVIDVPSLRGATLNDDGTWNFTLVDHPQIGYVQLTQFGDRTSDEMRERLDSLNRTTSALIIDLRNNTGGYLTAALDICDMLLDGKYKIIETRRRDGVLERQYFSKSGAVYDEAKPVVVLVNRMSASASEIVSACLQDHQRAVIIGERTWGKGTVQNVIPIDKDRSAIKLTVASYWRPSGENIDRASSELNGQEQWGVMPNPNFVVDTPLELLFLNMRMRYRTPPSGNLDAEPRQPPPATDAAQGNESSGGGSPDGGSPDTVPLPPDTEPTEATDEEPSATYGRVGDNLDIDPVLQKAVEYLQGVLRNSIAA